MPAVSVLMVFHRDTPFLRPAIASVLGQSFRDFEFLLVDNGTGLAPEALGELGRDPRLRWVRLARNEGIPAGHNAGVRAARGEFVALLDYDDLALPQRFERQVAALRADPSLGLVSSLATRIDENDRPCGKVFCLPDPAGHRLYSQYAAPIVTPAIMGRLDVFTATPYRTEFPVSADLDFQARVFERWRAAVLPEVLLHYRTYAAQTTQERHLAIERSRAAIQLLAARRRAVRPEEIASALAVTAGQSSAGVWRRGAAQCLAEGFPLLAAYHARRSAAVERSLPAALRAAKLALRAVVRSRGVGRIQTLRMVLTGPVRTHGLTPA